MAWVLRPAKIVIALAVITNISAHTFTTILAWANCWVRVGVCAIATVLAWTMAVVARALIHIVVAIDSFPASATRAVVGVDQVLASAVRTW